MISFLRRYSLLAPVVLSALLASAGAIAHAEDTEDTDADATATKPTTSALAKPPAPWKIGSLVVTGSERLRFEAWNWFTATPPPDGTYNFAASQLRLGLGEQRRGHDWLIEMNQTTLADLPHNAIAPAPQGQLGFGGSYFAANGRQIGSVFIKQGYFRLKDFLSPANSLRLGRFEYIDGTEVTPKNPTLAALKRDHIAHRLLGNFAFTHVGRSFDGVQFVRDTPSANFTLLGARPTEGVFQLDGMSEISKVNLAYAAITKPLVTGANSHSAGSRTHTEDEARLFGLYYREGRNVLKTDNRSLAARTADTQPIGITTMGGHYIRTFKGGGGTGDLLFWGAYQTGKWGTLDQRAGAIAAEVGYQPTGMKLKPWFRAGYFIGTGDNNANDTTHRTFFPVLPTPRLYARFPFFNEMNNQDVFGQVYLRPHPRMNVRVDVHALTLANEADLWYVGGGAFQRGTFGYNSRPSNGKRGLATLLDLSVDYQLDPRSSVNFYLAGAFGGDAVSRIYPADQRARLLYLEFTRKF